MKKVLILTAVMAFAMMLGFGVQSAQADRQEQVLFPYFTSGGGDVTFVQTINTKTDDANNTDTTATKMVKETPGQATYSLDKADGDMGVYTMIDKKDHGATPGWAFRLTDDDNWLSDPAVQAYMMSKLGVTLSHLKEQYEDYRPKIC